MVNGSTMYGMVIFLSAYRLRQCQQAAEVMWCMGCGLPGAWDQSYGLVSARFGSVWFGLGILSSGIGVLRARGSVCWAVRLLGCRAVAAVLDDNSSPFCARSPWRLTPCLMDEKAIDVTSWGAKVAGECVRGWVSGWV